MRVVKLSTGHIVQLLHVSRVVFDTGTWACVTPRLERPLVHRNDPYWVPASLVVWVLDF